MLFRSYCTNNVVYLNSDSTLIFVFFINKFEYELHGKRKYNPLTTIYDFSYKSEHIKSSLESCYSDLKIIHSSLDTISFNKSYSSYSYLRMSPKYDEGLIYFQRKTKVLNKFFYLGYAVQAYKLDREKLRKAMEISNNIDISIKLVE